MRMLELPRSMKHVVVFCGSSAGHDPKYAEAAHAMGNALAKQGINLVYGGGRVGLMGAVAKGALEGGTKVIGIIPDFLKQKEVHHTGLHELVVVDTMHERKLLMHERSEGIIMLPGGFGTFEEFFEMLTWAQLGLHQHPIAILNTNGFYNDLLAMMQTMVDKGFVKQANLDLIVVADEPEALVHKMKAYRPQMIPKWIEKDQ